MRRFRAFCFASAVVAAVAGAFACSADYHSAATQEGGDGGTTGNDGGPNSGDPCPTAGAVLCDSAASALYCNAGTYEEISCRGPNGCTSSSTGTTCDDDLANVGDGCAVSTNQSYYCGTDHKSELVCENGTFSLHRECRGPGGCQISNGLIDCDNTIATVGDPCTTGTYACSVDAETLLHCESSAFVANNTCRGPNQCVIVARDGGKTADCDDSKALPGDVCDEPNEPTCSVDSTEELICSSGGTFVDDQACPSCVRSSSGITCN